MNKGDKGNKGFTLPVQIKAIGEDGSFSGYAAVFGNVDLGDDLIIKGAFSKWLTSIGSDFPSVCWQHDFGSPIGITTKMYEDDHGLYVEGKLTLGVTQADDARLLAQSGAVKGMSIGYWVHDREYNNEGVRLLKELSCYEYSFVTSMMNPLAKFTSVKTADLGSIKECEIYLRDVCGLSRTESKTLIAKIKGARDADPEDEPSDLMSSLKALQTTIAGA